MGARPLNCTLRVTYAAVHQCKWEYYFILIFFFYLLPMCLKFNFDGEFTILWHNNIKISILSGLFLDSIAPNYGYGESGSWQRTFWNRKLRYLIEGIVIWCGSELLMRMWSHKYCHMAEFKVRGDVIRSKGSACAEPEVYFWETTTLWCMYSRSRY